MEKYMTNKISWKLGESILFSVVVVCLIVTTAFDVSSATVVSRRSNCRERWTQLFNSSHSDPVCVKILNRNISFNDAKELCHMEGGYLAEVKEPSFNLSSLMNRTSRKFWIGVEEKYLAEPVHNHQLIYVSDHTAVGSYKPWSIDCVIGAGYDYAGMISQTYTGLTCQPWNSDFPHHVKFRPINYQNVSNHCRNPTLDENGPWCYTMSAKVKWQYCRIPQCVTTESTIAGSQLMEFQLFIPCHPSNEDYHHVLKVSFRYAGNTTTASLTVSDCAYNDENNWVNVSSTSKFVWDSGRSRIVNTELLKCIEASTLDVGSEVSLQDCQSNKDTQIWIGDQQRLIVKSPHTEALLHLEMSPANKLFLSSQSLNSWEAVITGEFHYDLAKLARPYNDKSIVLYSAVDKKCLTVISSSAFSETSTSSYGEKMILILSRCASDDPNQIFTIHSSGKNPIQLLNPKTGRCIAVSGIEVGAHLMLEVCANQHRQYLFCEDNFSITMGNSPRLQLTSVAGIPRLKRRGGVLSSWGNYLDLMTPICENPRGSSNIGQGMQFALRNLYYSACLQADVTNNITLMECDDDAVVWQFTQVHTIIRHSVVHRCIKVVYNDENMAVTIVLADCDTADDGQHWLVFSHTNTMRGSSNTNNNNQYYGLYRTDLVSMLSANQIQPFIRLRDERLQRWLASNRYRHLYPVSAMSDCIASNSTNSYYDGMISTTKSGKRCRSWPPSWLRRYPKLRHNYCSNPGETGSSPWCFVDEEKMTREECLLPLCNQDMKVAINWEGEWIAQSGKELNSVVCQTEAECKRGNGENYRGDLQVTKSGKVCAKWKNRTISSNHNYCRNPRGESEDLWCYLNEEGLQSEVCSLQQCVSSCMSLPKEHGNEQVVEHSFASNSWGYPTGSRAYVRCTSGHSFPDGSNIMELTCDSGTWFLGDRMTCSPHRCDGGSLHVDEADLNDTSIVEVGQFISFVCTDGMKLTQPGSNTVDYYCDESGELLKPQHDTCIPPCNVGYTQYKDYCYQVFTKNTTFLNAYRECQIIEASMVSVETEEEFEFLVKLLEDVGNKYWIGIQHDVMTSTINDKSPFYRNYKYYHPGHSSEDRSSFHSSLYLPIIYPTFPIMQVATFNMDPSLDDKNHNLSFEHISNSTRCMYVKRGIVGLRDCDGWSDRSHQWMWISSHHLYHVATKMCLTGKPVNGLSENDIEAELKVARCDWEDGMQMFTCEVVVAGVTSLKMAYQHHSYVVGRAQDRLDRVEIGGAKFGNLSSNWMIDEETRRNICHSSIRLPENVTTTTQPRDHISWGLAIELSVANDSHGLKEIHPDQAVDGYICRKSSRFHCGEPPHIMFASVKNTQSYVVNSQIVYTCAKGMWFRNRALTQVVTCGIDLKWNPDPASLRCTLVECPTPDQVPMATSSLESLSSAVYGSVARYRCNEGYWFAPGVFSTHITCSHKGVWKPQHLQCKKVVCEPPGDLKHGNITFTDDGSLMNLSCAPGYWFQPGMFTMTSQCTSNATWNPTPNPCYEVICEGSKPQPHGVFDYKSSTELIFSCTEGYQLHISMGWWNISSEVELSCSSTGKWIPDVDDFTCQKMMCSDPDAIERGEHHVIAASYPYNMQITYECDKGNTLTEIFIPYVWIFGMCLHHETDGRIRASVSSCKTSQSLVFQWRTNTNNRSQGSQLYEVNHNKCLATKLLPNSTQVVLMNCDDDSHLNWVCGPHGTYYQTLQIMSDTTKSYRFVLAMDSQTRYLQTSATVSDGIDLISYQHRYLYEGKDLCSYRRRSTRQKTTCLGVWHPHPSAVKCIESICPPIASIPHATTVRPTSTRYGSTTKVTCEDGYLVLGEKSSYQLRCSIDEMWLPDPKHIPCEPVKCKTILLRDDLLLLSGQIDGKSTKDVSISCWPGRRFSDGRDVITDGCNEMDNRTLPSCKTIVCTEPPTLTHALMYHTGTFQTGSRVRYVCIEDYKFASGVHVHDIQCNSVGVWESSPQNPTCIMVECAQPPQVENAISDIPQSPPYRSGSNIYYKCHRGMHFEYGDYGENPRKFKSTCWADGKWHPDPSALRCKFEHEVPQDNCTATTGRNPNCIHNMKCDPPPVVDNASMLVTSLNISSWIQYKCHTGFTISPLHDISHSQCTSNGTSAKWIPDPSTIKCKAVACGDPGHIEHSIASNFAANTGFGDIVFISCKEGYTMDGILSQSTYLQCNQYGLWQPSPSTVKCSAVVCPEPLLPFYTKISKQIELELRVDAKTGYCFYPMGSILLVECHQPQVFSSSGINTKTIKCTSDGTWSGNLKHDQCIDRICSAPPVGHRSLLIHANPYQYGRYKVGGKVVFGCEECHQFASGQHHLEATCLPTGNWTHHFQSGVDCIAVQCPRVKAPVNGRILFESLSCGGISEVICDAGFAIHNSIYTARCGNDERWHPSIHQFKCLPVKCDDEPEVGNADVTRYTVGNIRYLRFDCHPQFSFGHNITRQESRCLSNGEWLPIKRMCIPYSYFTCGLPTDLENSEVVKVRERWALLGCFPGFRYNSSGLTSQLITCSQSGGGWRNAFTNTTVEKCQGLLACFLPFPS